MEIRPEGTRRSPETTLDVALKEGGGQFGVARGSSAAIRLVLRCDAVLGALLRETALGPDQSLRTLADDRIEVRVSVTDSWELRWWILGHAAQVEVMAPAALRREIAESLRTACARY